MLGLFSADYKTPCMKHYHNQNLPNIIKIINYAFVINWVNIITNGDKSS